MRAGWRGPGGPSLNLSKSQLSLGAFAAARLYIYSPGYATCGRYAVEHEGIASPAALGAMPPHGAARHVLTLLERVMAELGQEDCSARDALREATRLLRGRLAPDAKAIGDEGETGHLLAWQVRRVCAYIDAHMAGPLRIADLCALIQRSEAHFSRSFKRTFGTSPHAYLVRHRLQRAAEYMLQTDASLSEIALRCGFADQAHLCKLFRKEVGSTPGAWRRVRRASTAIRESEAAPQFRRLESKAV